MGLRSAAENHLPCPFHRSERGGLCVWVVVIVRVWVDCRRVALRPHDAQVSFDSIVIRVYTR